MSEQAPPSPDPSRADPGQAEPGPAGPLPPGPGDPGQVSRSLASSVRHRVVTRIRLARMAPRRRRALRALHEGTRPKRRPARPWSEPRILVIAHVYYPELWDELADRIDLVPGSVELVVTLVSGRADHLAGSIATRFPGAAVRIVENRGRDLWPLVQVLDVVPGHDLVLKVHTKRSPHMRRGDAWRAELLDGVCGSTGRVAGVIGAFAQDPRIGLVAPPGNVFGREFLGNNGTWLRELAARGGLPYDLGHLWFPAGSMFWARPAVLLPLAQLGLTAEDFGAETGAIDGTLPHALERYLGLVALSQGLAVVESTEVDRILADVQRTETGP